MAKYGGAVSEWIRELILGTRPVISQHRETLKVDPRVQLRGGSDWLTVTVRGKDRQFVAQLLRWAIDASRR